MIFDTIAAVSTPAGQGGIGIVRISGEKAISVLDQIFVPKSGKKTEALKNFALHYGHIYENKYSGSLPVDEVLVSVMRGPHTYSGEDTVEINCHGGFFLVSRILAIVLSHGVREARRGEFTKRAFLNGRMDLTKAEATLDLIESKNDSALQISFRQLRGDISRKISRLKELLLAVAAHVNVILDYPEEGIEEPLPEELKENLRRLKRETQELIFSYDSGKMIKEGIKTAIIGKPNVGKSSILNALVREERAIVTNIPGTTRDSIEESIRIKGLHLNLVDTAGIRHTADAIENLGVARSKEVLKKADLILFVLDGSGMVDADDRAVYEEIPADKRKKCIGILNKTDLGTLARADSFGGIENWISISALRKEGIENLEEKIYRFSLGEENIASGNRLILTNIRHKNSLEKVKTAVDNLLDTIEAGYPLDLLSVDLKEALDALGEITGETIGEEMLDHIFEKFCVGK